ELLPAIEPYLARVSDALRVTLRCRLQAIQESYRPAGLARATGADSKSTPAELTDPVTAVTIDEATPLAGPHLSGERWGQAVPPRVPTVEGQVDVNTSMAGSEANVRTMGYFPEGEGDKSSTVIRTGEDHDRPKVPDNRQTSKADFVLIPG